MKLLPLAIVLTLSGVYSSSGQENPSASAHLSDHDHASSAPSNLMNQLGYDLVEVEDRLINGKYVTALPLAAVFQEQGRTFVIAPDDHEAGKFERWEVSLGQIDGHFAEALKGIFPGDRVIVQQRKLASFQGESNPKKTSPPRPAPATSAKPPVPSSVAEAKPAAASTKPAVSAKKNYGVQVGAFSKAEAANRLAEQLKPQYGRADVLVSESKGRSLYRVRVGEFPSNGAASQVSAELKSKGFPQSFVVAY